MQELYIGGYFIELSESTRIGVTIQANTLSDLNNRQGSFTNEFKVPATANNQIALGHAGNLNSATDIPYRKTTVKYIQDGIEILNEGFAIIKSFSDYYSIVVYSGNVDFFDLVGEDLLNDLDLSDLDHDYTLSDVNATKTVDDGYIYALVDMRKKTSSLSFSASGLSPFMFVRTLIDRIAARVGYTVTGNLLNDNYYKNLILSTNFRRDEAWQKDKNSRSSLISDNNIHTIISSPTSSVYNLDFPDSGYIVGGGIYVVPEAIRASFSGAIPVQFGKTGFPFAWDPSDAAAIQIINITTNTILDQEIIFPATLPVGNVRNYTFTVNTAELNLSAGTQIQIRALFNYASTGVYDFAFLKGSIFQANVKNGFIPYLGGSVNVSSIQHEMKQKDFIKGILNVFCAVPQTNVVTKTISFDKLNDINNNLYKAINWSEKLDTKKSVELIYRDSNFAKKNYIRYSNDQDVIDEINLFSSRETDGYFVVDDDCLDGDKTIVQLPFSGGVSNLIPYKNDDFTIDRFTPRLLFLNRFYEKPPNGVVLENHDVNYASFGYAIYYGYEGLSFSEQLNHYSQMENYSAIKSIMNRYKKVIGYFDLSASEITSVNHLVPISLDIHYKGVQINGNFYLNKIENYKQGESTKCELIRL